MLPTDPTTHRYTALLNRVACRGRWSFHDLNELWRIKSGLPQLPESWFPRFAAPRLSVRFPKAGTYRASEHGLLAIDATEGYAVALQGHEHRIANGDELPVEVLEELERLCLASTMDAHPKYVGVWVDPDDGAVVLDLVELRQDRNEAVALGRENAQKAIWSFASGRAIYL